MIQEYQNHLESLGIAHQSLPESSDITEVIQSQVRWVRQQVEPDSPDNANSSTGSNTPKRLLAKLLKIYDEALEAMKTLMKSIIKIVSCSYFVLRQYIIIVYWETKNELADR